LIPLNVFFLLAYFKYVKSLFFLPEFQKFFGIILPAFEMMIKGAFGDIKSFGEIFNGELGRTSGFQKIEALFKPCCFIEPSHNILPFKGSNHTVWYDAISDFFSLGKRIFFGGKEKNKCMGRLVILPFLP